MAERYWDGSEDAEWAENDNWADSDGGSPPASFPTSIDNATYTANGNPNVCTLSAEADVNDLTIEAGYTAKFDMGTQDLNVDGNMLLALPTVIPKCSANRSVYTVYLRPMVELLSFGIRKSMRRLTNSPAHPEKTNASTVVWICPKCFRVTFTDSS